MGMEAVIEGSIHGMCIFWSQHAHKEFWRFIIIDALNSFN